MEIEEIIGPPDFSAIIDLINAEWPLEFGEVEDEEKKTIKWPKVMILLRIQ